MKLTEAFAKKTYRNRIGEVPVIEKDNIANADRYNNWLRSLQLEQVEDLDEIRKLDWHPRQKSMRHIMTVMEKGWHDAKFYVDPKGGLLLMHDRHGDWFASKKKWSRQVFATHLRRWWSKDEIQED